MSANRGRVHKRMHQACENCRRKKTRCPGESPACSTCSRLRQVCTYTESNGNSHEHGEDLETRMAQLEERMNAMREQTIGGPNVQTEPSLSSSTQAWSQRDRLRAGPASATSPNALPAKETIVDTINVYLQNCHMQPLWLFDRSDLSQPESCNEETILALMAIAVPYLNPTQLQGRREDLGRRYAQLAREQIMLRIAQSNVDLSTIQSLCMLAYANFFAKDMHFASLHINIAVTLVKCAGMDIESQPDDSSVAAETRRKVFWSLQYLDQICGQYSAFPNVLTSIENPRYVGWQMDLQRESNKLPPSMPPEVSQDGSIQRRGIWAYMVQLSALWRQVRTYLSHCADGNIEPPWSAGSWYSTICAHLMDLETKLPIVHRYDMARFSERSTEELQRNRAYWSPWLFLQFTYHAIHSMLNHPFLYSSQPQRSAQLAVPNTFWKTSSELALIHTTWIVRLIDMVSEKSYQVSDPFIGHCSAIAATIFIYFCRAADTRLRQAAENRLATCTRFLSELAMKWPMCHTTHEKLRELVKSALPSQQQPAEHELSYRTVWINTSLMWEILDYTYEGKSRTAPRGEGGLFHSSLCRRAVELNEEDYTVETQIFHSSTHEVDTSDGGQALPPVANHAVRQHAYTRQGRNERHGERITVSSSTDPATSRMDSSVPLPPPPESTLWPAVFTENMSVMDMAHDPLMQFHDLGSPFPGSWQFGNL